MAAILRALRLCLGPVDGKGDRLAQELDVCHNMIIIDRRISVRIVKLHREPDLISSAVGAQLDSEIAVVLILAC
jgi:hypothetical protein